MVIFRNRASEVLYDFLSIHESLKLFLLPVNICPIVPLIFHLRAIPFEFIDIDSSTLCIDEELVLEKVKQKPKAFGGVLFNHTYGTDYSPVSFFQELKNISENILIIDDKCLCQPEFTVPSLLNRDLILYSTGYSKVVDMGYGGYGFVSGSFPGTTLIVPESSNPSIELNDLSNQFKLHLLFENKFQIDSTAGFRTSMPETDWNQYKDLVINSELMNSSHRQDLINFYKNGLDSSICLNDRFQKWRFNILTTQKDQILKDIFSNKLFASSHYQPLTKNTDKQLYPNAFSLFDSIINLFIDRNYSLAAAEKTTIIINSLTHT